MKQTKNEKRGQDEPLADGPRPPFSELTVFKADFIAAHSGRARARVRPTVAQRTYVSGAVGTDRDECGRNLDYFATVTIERSVWKTLAFTGRPRCHFRRLGGGGVDAVAN